MNYLTIYYKNLSEQLEEKIFILEKFLLLEKPKPSIEDQLAVADSVIDYYNDGMKAKGIENLKFDIPAGPSNVGIYFGHGSFPKNKMGVFAYLPQRLQDLKLDPNVPLIGVSRFNVNTSAPEGNYDGYTGKMLPRTELTLAHEVGGHGSQYAARARDVLLGKNVDPFGFTQKQLEGEKKLNLRLSTVPEEDAQKVKWSQYVLDQDEVNARSVAAGRSVSKTMRDIAGENLENKVNIAAGTQSIRTPLARLGEIEAMGQMPKDPPPGSTRHERSQWRRAVINAQQDAKNATARAIQRTEEQLRAELGLSPNALADVNRSKHIELQNRLSALMDPNHISKPTVWQRTANSIRSLPIQKSLNLLDPVENTASEGLSRVASSIGLGSEIGMAASMVPMAVGAFTSSAGETPWDLMTSNQRKQYEEDLKRQRIQSVKDLIGRGYDPSQPTPLQRQN